MKSRILIVLLAAAFVLIAVPTASFAQPPPHEVHVTINDLPLEGCDIAFRVNGEEHSVRATDVNGIAWIQLEALPETWEAVLDSRCVGQVPAASSQLQPGNVMDIFWNVADFIE